MNAGKKRVEDEQAASIDSDKQFRFEELARIIFNHHLSTI
jgi:hypothetical protein